MASPVSLIIANIYVENFKDRALSTAQNPLRLWKRNVDDTFEVQYTEHKSCISIISAT